MDTKTAIKSVTFDALDLPIALKSIRQSKGLSQKEVAKAVGIKSAATISHYETGARQPSLEDLVSLLWFYGWEMSIKLERKSD